MAIPLRVIQHSPFCEVIVVPVTAGRQRFAGQIHTAAQTPNCFGEFRHHTAQLVIFQFPHNVLAVCDDLRVLQRRVKQTFQAEVFIGFEYRLEYLPQVQILKAFGFVFLLRLPGKAALSGNNTL